MPLAASPEWQTMALYAIGAAVLLFALVRLPVVGKLISGAVSLALMALFVFVLLRQAPFDPTLARITERMGLSGQAVAGEEVRIRMSADGHFWADAAVNGVRRRMLIDSGATVTAISDETARLAAVEPEIGLLPVILRTANGDVAARTAAIDLTLGGIEARNLKVVTAPAIGSVDVLGMNFLSQLASWRVEGRTLILAPKPKAEPKTKAE